MISNINTSDCTNSFSLSGLPDGATWSKVPVSVPGLTGEVLRDPGQIIIGGS